MKPNSVYLVSEKEQGWFHQFDVVLAVYKYRIFILTNICFALLKF